METSAKARYIRIAPKKARLVADAVRGLNCGEALNKLKFTPKKAARLLGKVISSAVANAGDQTNVDVDRLYIKRVFVDQGPMLKRWRARAMGRAYIVRKRTSHITVVVDER